MKFPFRHTKKASLILISLMLRAEMSHAQACTQWSELKQLGSLPATTLREASGACLSRAQSNQAYWINDSGNKTVLHYGPIDGQNLSSVEIKDFDAKDSEALACGRCEEGPCVILADIGDNNRKRKTVKIAFFHDLGKWPESVRPYREIEVTYPDGPHDAEAIFLTPEGDLVIVTKELHLKSFKATAAVLYRIEKKAMHFEGKKALPLQKIGELPLPKWLKDEGLRGQIVTDASVNEKRQMLGLLTYESLIEIPLVKLKNIKNSSEWQKDLDYHVVSLKALPQQETVFYTNEDSVIWSTEYFPPQAPIFSMTCERAGN